MGMVTERRLVIGTTANAGSKGRGEIFYSFHKERVGWGDERCGGDEAHFKDSFFDAPEYTTVNSTKQKSKKLFLKLHESLMRHGDDPFGERLCAIVSFLQTANCITSLLKRKFISVCLTSNIIKRASKVVKRLQRFSLATQRCSVREAEYVLLKSLLMLLNTRRDEGFIYKAFGVCEGKKRIWHIFLYPTSCIH